MIKKIFKGYTIPLFLVLIILIIISFGLGRYSIALNDLSSEALIVLLKIRLPRILMAVLIGMALSAAGTSFQCVFHNQLAAPDILGASSGACFGAALAILLGLSSFFITGFAFITSMLSIVLVYTVNKFAKGNQVIILLLAGIMIGSLFSSGTSFIKLVADPNNTLPAITYWLLGSLSGTNINNLILAVFPIMSGILVLYLLRWRINVLTLPDDEIKSIGVNVKRLRLIIILCASLLTASAVSFGGMIGWVGLVIPNLSRRLVGNDTRKLLPTSVLLGGIFLLFVDDLSRTLLATEIPIGILTAFIGAPFFIYLMIKKGGDSYS